MKSLVRFFATEHLFGNLLTIVIILGGIYATLSIRKEVFPNVNFDITTVTTILPGASPEQIESLLINPIEEALREVDGIKKVFSTATESSAVVIIQLDPDARSADKTNRDIQLAIDRIDNLPEEAEDPIVRIVESGQQPLIEVNVGGDIPELEIRKAAKFLADELSLMPMVARVGKNGYRKREYIIETDPKKMANRKVSMTRIIQALSERNISVPGGPLRNEKGQELLVRTEAEFQSAEDILKTVIISNDEGFGTTVGDIATVREGQVEPTYLYRSNGKPSIDLVIVKKEKADALKLLESVQKRVEELKSKLPQGIEIDYTKDLTVYLKNRLSVLESNVYLGLFLVIVILTLFLPFRVALVVASGVPIALFATFIVLYNMGSSVNVIGLMGMIIVLGMLVDDAIVVSENIWRHVELEGGSEATIVKGVTEVIPPVFASVLTTVLAFAPMMFMSGIFGKFIYEIPLAVILALLFSLFEAFIIMPSHFASWVSPYVEKIKASKPKESGLYKKTVELYTRYLHFAVAKRYVNIGLITVFFVLTMILASNTKFVLFPPVGVERFFIRIEATKEVSLRQMSELLVPIEKVISKLPQEELQDYVAQIGLIQMDANDPLSKRGPNYAQILVELTPEHKRERLADEIIEQLRKEIVNPPQVTRLTFEPMRGGPPQGRPVSLDVRGKDFNELSKVADILKERLSKIDGVVDIQDSMVEGKDQWTVYPRHRDTANLGLTAREIGINVRAFFDGVVATSVRDYDEEIDIRVTREKKAEKSEAQLKSLMIGNQFGNLIPLSEVADLKMQPTQSAIIHNQYKRVVNVSADVDINKITSGGVQKLLAPQFAEILKPFPNSTIVFGGESEDTEESMKSLGRAFIVAAVSILCVLIMTFKSLLKPILILFTIPIGFMGVVYALNLHGMPFSFMALLGVVALAGVIVNNSIVYLEFVSIRRKAGARRLESLVDAATTRLRPILLTTSTTLAGLMPTAYGDHISRMFGYGGADPFVIPLALSLGWGLGIGAVLNALFFPSLVAVLDDVYIIWAKFRGKPSPILE